MELGLMTWPQVEQYLETKSTIIVPIGSTEQHGPTGLIGTDYITADAVAQAAGQRLKTLVAPKLCFGMANHHMAFPGTISLSPMTYTQVITEMCQSLYQHGFRKIAFVNGHGGNIAPVTTGFCQAQMTCDDVAFDLINWWTLKPVADYEREHFGDLAGFHATIGEVSVTMHLHREAYEHIPETTFSPSMRAFPWPQGPHRFRAEFPDGTMFSDPSLATPEHGATIFDLAVSAICERLDKAWSL